MKLEATPYHILSERHQNEEKFRQTTRVYLITIIDILDRTLITVINKHSSLLKNTFYTMKQMQLSETAKQLHVYSLNHVLPFSCR